jgi:hypothetical protein
MWRYDAVRKESVKKREKKGEPHHLKSQPKMVPKLLGCDGRLGLEGMA